MRLFARSTEAYVQTCIYMRKCIRYLLQLVHRHDRLTGIMESQLLRHRLRREQLPRGELMRKLNSHTHTLLHVGRAIPLPFRPAHCGLCSLQVVFRSGFGLQGVAAPIPPSAPISRMAPRPHQARGPCGMPLIGL